MEYGLPSFFTVIQKRNFTLARKFLLINKDTEWAILDGSYIKTHQHSTGAFSEENQAIGLSRGGSTSKIHPAVDSYSLPIEFILTGGEAHDSKVVNALIEVCHKDISSLRTKVMTVKRFERKFVNEARLQSSLESKIREKETPI